MSVTIDCHGARLSNNLLSGNRLTNITGRNNNSSLPRISVTGYISAQTLDRQLRDSRGVYDVTIIQTLGNKTEPDQLFSFRDIETDLKSLLQPEGWDLSIRSQTFTPFPDSKTSQEAVSSVDFFTTDGTVLKLGDSKSLQVGIYTTVLTTENCNDCAITCGTIGECRDDQNANCNVCDDLKYEYILEGSYTTMRLDYTIKLQINNELQVSSEITIPTSEISLRLVNKGDDVVEFSFDLTQLTNCPLALEESENQPFVLAGSILQLQPEAIIPFTYGNTFLTVSLTTPNCIDFNESGIYKYYATTTLMETPYKVVRNATINFIAN